MTRRPNTRTVKCSCGSFDYYSIVGENNEPLWKCFKCKALTPRQVRNREMTEKQMTHSESTVAQTVEQYRRILITKIKEAKKMNIIVSSRQTDYVTEVDKKIAEDVVNRSGIGEFDVFSLQEEDGSFVLSPLVIIL